MKNLFVSVKLRTIIIAICFVLILASLIVFFSVKQTYQPKPDYTIVIDAGHGGRDGGAVGDKTGITESELNLKYALQLKSICEEYGMKVILTRKDMNGLYEEGASNKKKSEMEKRKNIINNSGADLMVSLHMNSFPLKSSQGAYVFYAKGSQEGYALAKAVQSAICLSFENARKTVSVGDYFVLNYSIVPSVLIECGFLSNPTEEIQLQKDDYCKSFCYSVLAGILSYFKM